MSLFDDLTGFLDDVREVGQEFEALKDDVVSSVLELGRELTGDEEPADGDEAGQS